MKAKPTDLKMLRLNESALVWDDSRQEFVTAYRRDFMRLQNVVFIDGVTFDSTAEAYTSDAFECSAYSKGLLFIAIDVTASPTHIIFSLQMSSDKMNWYNYAEGFFSDLRFVTAQGDLQQCFSFPVLSNYIRVYALSSGCDGSNTFKVFSNITFNG